jgi:glucose/arabinose dehydrogenase
MSDLIKGDARSAHRHAPGARANIVAAGVTALFALVAGCGPAYMMATPGIEAAPRPASTGGLIVASATNTTVRPAEVEPTEARIAGLRVPTGFAISVFARDLEQPRVIVAAPNGGVYVTEREPGRVTFLRDSNGDGRADIRRVVATGLRDELRGVHGLAIHQNRLYMVTETELYSAPIQADGSLGERRRITGDIPAGGQHPNRTIAFSPDGQLYLSIGSTCNACREPKEEHATMLRVNTENGEKQIVARGLRNTIGFAWHPASGQLWGLDHNSDGRGDNWPPEELNRILPERHYGWPWCGGDRQVDWQVPEDPDQPRQQFCQGTEAPALTYTAHAAPMQLVFYTGNAFPADYRNDAFVTMRGSWNRNPPAGYEVVRIRFDAQGNPLRIEPFANGWLVDAGRGQMGRLMGLTQAADGSLLVGDDHNGIIYRIAWRGN